MSKLMNIVKAEPSHITSIAMLEKQCFSDSWSQNAVAQELENSQARVFVALAGEQAVGYASMHIVCDEGCLNRIAVLEESRHSGIGALLLRAIVDGIESENLSFITLEVRASNFVAIHLYEKFGFKSLGQRKNFYTKPIENALIMRIEGDKNENIGH